MNKTLLLLIPMIVGAHDMWLEKSPQNYTLKYGHLHPTKAHGGSKEMPYDAKGLKEVLCLKGTNVQHLNAAKRYPIKIAKQCDALYVRLDMGYFTKTPYGTKHLPKNKTKMALKSWHSIESVKRVDGTRDTLLGKHLEIVRLNTPQKGEKARLQVYFDGKPSAGVPVAYDGSVRGATDKEGRINIRLKHGGLQNIQATRKTPCKDRSMCDEKIETATLNFEVGS